jgi:hypothetical protein
VHRIFAPHPNSADGLDRPVHVDLHGDDLQVERAMEATRRRGSIY